MTQKFSFDGFKKKLRRLMFGMRFYDGLLYKIVVYTLLVSFAYVYLYPVLFMVMNSLMGVNDLINDGVRWIPTEWNFTNYERAFVVLKMWDPANDIYLKSLFDTMSYVLKASLTITATSALIGYGFARFDFPFKKLLFVFMLATFILPSQVTMVSTIGIYRQLGILSTEWAMILPAFFGQGLNQAIYILIFYQFFRTIPIALYESAEVDGAGQLRIFRSIAIPLAIPSIVIVLLFSFVWYWNETFLTSLFTGDSRTLPLLIGSFQASFEQLYPPGSAGSQLNESVVLAANLVAILPLLILYFVGQKQFTESIDRTGITGE